MKASKFTVDFGTDISWQPNIQQMPSRRASHTSSVSQATSGRQMSMSRTGNIAALRHCSQCQGRVFKEALKLIAAADMKERLSATSVESSSNRHCMTQFLGLGICTILRTLFREPKVYQSKWQ
jgi:hypothetical protein